MTIDTSIEDEFTYSQTTVIAHGRTADQVIHTDANTLKRIADA